LNAEKGCCTAWVAHAACAKRDRLGRGCVLNKSIGYHFSRRLIINKVEYDASVQSWWNILTERNINDIVEPVSACSPTDLSRRVGSRDRIRTTGVPDLSWRNRDNDEVRKCRRDESRSGRKGKYAERKWSPSVMTGSVR
jgi:hypothetical protein